MTNLTQLRLHIAEAQGMLALIDREIAELQRTEQMSIADARAALRAAWESAKASSDKRIMTPARWLNSSEEAASLAGNAGFADILDAAAWLDGVKA